MKGNQELAREQLGNAVVPDLACALKPSESTVNLTTESTNFRVLKWSFVRIGFHQMLESRIRFFAPIQRIQRQAYSKVPPVPGRLLLHLGVGRDRISPQQMNTAELLVRNCALRIEVEHLVEDVLRRVQMALRDHDHG